MLSINLKMYRIAFLYVSVWVYLHFSLSFSVLITLYRTCLFSLLQLSFALHFVPVSLYTTSVLEVCGI